ncbi:MAG: type II toxin-antitoxin system prevent-host-death family antitoxin [Deltaproteobacteria bacterium]|jgi:antitoxin (DNA-binding transcriptional repressor) of toxin-antitoxin stability system|nr:type II toxin-antitoxin system prevent-host-death family antitoxin [Deltaproteobacteria bacterium]
MRPRHIFLKIIKRAKDGDGFIITDGDKPLVKIIPYVEPKKSRSLDVMHGQCIVPDDVEAVGREEIIVMFEGQS